ncbi:hypothetical protein [Nocardia sp. XZ_19_369]|uniref:hypothetical protein n=1 Tax=Nocardia sp. XZ_19_369 TaxID=2769487 RepID=UPI00188E8AE3|nr:hypothetical protein [Nocardia sp. XZ_19_369]
MALTEPQPRALGALSADKYALPRLPDWHRIIAAVRGETVEPGFVLQLARAFALLHHTRRIEPRRIAEIDCRRDELIAALDAWVMYICATRSTPPPESAGRAVDAIAAAVVDADHCRLTATDPIASAVHQDGELSARHANHWTALITQIDAGQHRRHHESGAVA